MLASGQDFMLQLIIMIIANMVAIGIAVLALVILAWLMLFSVKYMLNALMKAWWEW